MDDHHDFFWMNSLNLVGISDSGSLQYHFALLTCIPNPAYTSIFWLDHNLYSWHGDFSFCRVHLLAFCLNNRIFAVSIPWTFSSTPHNYSKPSSTFQDWALYQVFSVGIWSLSSAIIWQVEKLPDSYQRQCGRLIFGQVLVTGTT